ncbi:DUF4340 domain-containing protein [bacterium]|nr:DUF4340 domain-containing protein [bacterium]
MKKEYLLLVVVIVGLAALLVYQKKGKTNYQLPELTHIDAPVNHLVLAEEGRTVELRQVDGSWVVGPVPYRADNVRAAKMVDEIINLQLVALISEKENYQLYELNDKKCFVAKLYNDQTLLREVVIGKNSASLRQTYVMLADDPNVYQALGNLRRNFFSTIPELRDKKVLQISWQERKKLNKISLERLVDGEIETLEMVKITPDANSDESKVDAANGESTPVSGWQVKSGALVDDVVISGLLDAISELKCTNYLEELDLGDFEKPTYRVLLSGAASEFSIAFLEHANNEYQALSSQSTQPFLLPAWQAGKIVKDFADYTDVEKKAPGGEK